MDKSRRREVVQKYDLGPEKKRGREIVQEYSLEHWPADMLPDKYREVDYKFLVEEAVKDLARGKKAGERMFVRLAGQSGTGKSTQLLPMAEEYFRVLSIEPVVVGARFFVKYHPYLREIAELVGEANLREATHEFTVQMLFESLMELMERGYPIILDVTLLDPKVEDILINMLYDAEYWFFDTHLMVVAKEISDGFIKKREKGGAEGKRKVRKTTSEEFARATPLALRYYAKKMASERIIMWSAWDEEPVFIGRFRDPEVDDVWKKYQSIKKLPFEKDEEKLREAKKEWAREKWVAMDAGDSLIEDLGPLAI